MSRANRTTFLCSTIISSTGSAKKKKLFVCIDRGSESRLYQRLFVFRNYEIRLLRHCWIEWCLTQLRVRGIPLRTPLCAKQKGTHNHVRKTTKEDLTSHFTQIKREENTAFLPSKGPGEKWSFFI